MSRETELTIDDLVALLSQAIGNDKAEQEILGAAEALGLSRSSALSVPQALGILETVAESPGLVGVAARFAKSRLHLMGRARASRA